MCTWFFPNYKRNEKCSYRIQCCVQFLESSFFSLYILLPRRRQGKEWWYFSNYYWWFLRPKFFLITMKNKTQIQIVDFTIKISSANSNLIWSKSHVEYFEREGWMTFGFWAVSSTREDSYIKLYIEKMFSLHVTSLSFFYYTADTFIQLISLISHQFNPS